MFYREFIDKSYRYKSAEQKKHPINASANILRAIFQDLLQQSAEFDGKTIEK